MRGSKEILLATRPFAREERWRSWWHLSSTLVVLLVLIAFGTADVAWWIRLPGSVLAGLVLVRMFVLYHDQQHGAILRGSRTANFTMSLFGLAILNPPSVWKRSHDHHHHNNSKSFGLNAGSYPLLTTDLFLAASRRERFQYLASRHPLTIAAGYLTAFLFGMCVLPLLMNPRRHWDAGLSLLLHCGIAVWIAFGGIADLMLAVVLPSAIGSALGAYLFFAQHNFPGARLRTGADWDYTFAALRSSSYIRMGPMMRWFTGNIGYHHIHHVNAQIPFYRLPEAMQAIEEFQSPVTTSLHPRNIMACLRLKVWDPVRDELVPAPCKTGHRPDVDGSLAA
jgi:omega-6 fatty acid desaturase (delta-12 desaturase)